MNNFSPSLILLNTIAFGLPKDTPLGMLLAPEEGIGKNSRAKMQGTHSKETI